MRKKETVDGETRKREREEREIARKEGCFALSTRANSINELTFSYIIGGNDSSFYFLFKNENYSNRYLNFFCVKCFS